MRRSGANMTSAPNEQQVFVGSLPLEFTRETLIECFSQFGSVLDAKINAPLHDNKKVCLVKILFSPNRGSFEYKTSQRCKIIVTSPFIIKQRCPLRLKI
jgi:RNA recognition motif-containing protein